MQVSQDTPGASLSHCSAPSQGRQPHGLRRGPEVQGGPLERQVEPSLETLCQARTAGPMSGLKSCTRIQTAHLAEIVNFRGPNREENETMTLFLTEAENESER